MLFYFLFLIDLLTDVRLLDPVDVFTFLVCGLTLVLFAIFVSFGLKIFNILIYFRIIPFFKVFVKTFYKNRDRIIYLYPL
jgi:hypothetical protein